LLLLFSLLSGTRLRVVVLFPALLLFFVEEEGGPRLLVVVFVLTASTLTPRAIISSNLSTSVSLHPAG
jgi:hypothetical protein